MLITMMMIIVMMRITTKIIIKVIIKITIYEDNDNFTHFKFSISKAIHLPLSLSSAPAPPGERYKVYIISQFSAS